MWVEAPKGKDAGKEANTKERAEVAEEVGATAATDTVVGSSCCSATRVGEERAEDSWIPRMSYVAGRGRMWSCIVMWWE